MHLVGFIIKKRKTQFYFPENELIRTTALHAQVYQVFGIKLILSLSLSLPPLKNGLSFTSQQLQT